jgi:hypothetical protein
LGLKICHLATLVLLAKNAAQIYRLGSLDCRFIDWKREIFGSNFKPEPGLPDFSWYMIPKPQKMYQMNTKCTKWS